MIRAKRLARLEAPKGKSGAAWPDIFFYPINGTSEEQEAFTRKIERRRLARQLCFVIGGPDGYATEEEAESALVECFI